jgi:hypothetical protein
MCHRIPGVPKRTHLSWASQGSYIAYSKLHMLALTSFVSPVWYTAIHELSLLPFVAPPKKKKKTLYPGLLDSYIQNSKLDTLYIALS